MIRILFQQQAFETLHLNLADFVAAQTASLHYCALVLNGQFIPKNQYADTYLQDNDQLEVIQPMQGG